MNISEGNGIINVGVIVKNLIRFIVYLKRDSVLIIIIAFIQNYEQNLKTGHSCRFWTVLSQIFFKSNFHQKIVFPCKFPKISLVLLCSL